MASVAAPRLIGRSLHSSLVDLTLLNRTSRKTPFLEPNCLSYFLRSGHRQPNFQQIWAWRQRAAQFSTTAAHEKARTVQQLRTRAHTGPFSWKAGLLFIVTGAGMVVYFRIERARMERKKVAEMNKGIGRPKVGGPFVLMDLDGKQFTDENLRGKYSFVSLIASYLGISLMG